MENRNIWQIIKSVTIFSLLIVVNFFNPVSAQVPRDCSLSRNPVLVPATLQELNTSTTVNFHMELPDCKDLQHLVCHSILDHKIQDLYLPVHT